MTQNADTPIHVEKDTLRRAFADVSVWIFDLDNTLYPPEADLWPQVDQRITLYLGDMFGLDGLSARALQKYYYRRYGTTLKGLMDEHKISPDAFLEFAHQIDLRDLAPDPDLGEAIGKLPGGTYNRAYLRTYATFLGLDPEPLLRDYTSEEVRQLQSAEDDQLAAMNRAIEKRALSSEASGDPRMSGTAVKIVGLAAAAVIVLGITGGGVWYGV